MGPSEVHEEGIRTSHVFNKVSFAHGYLAKLLGWQNAVHFPRQPAWSRLFEVLSGIQHAYLGTPQTRD